jgi:hypothetical protein
MINQVDSDYTFNNAYVPEHLVDYVTSISGAKPHLFHQFLCYKRDETLIFVGYPLGEAFDQKQMEASLDSAIKSFKPGIISLIAPTITTRRERALQKGSDSYYRLELDAFSAPPRVQNMIRRATRELSMETRTTWNEEHTSLVAEFLATHKISEETRCIFARIPDYLATSKTALLLDARNPDGTLVAFDVADYGSKDYAFYMFNVISRNNYVPGASDLLLSELIAIARTEGKRFVNLGLAVHEGIAFFKQKWGGMPFLNHEYALYETVRVSIIESLLGRL